MDVKRTEEHYKTLFGSMREGFALHEVVCDDMGQPVDYRFLEINDAFVRLTGLKRENVIGKTVLEILPGNDPYWVETYGKVALTGEPVRFENFNTPLGRWYEIYAFSPIKRQFAVLFTDITDRKKHEEELHKLNRTLTAHNKSSHAMMRAQNESEYLQEVCRIIVEDCGHALVWIGYSENDESRSVRPVAYSGFEEGYLETLNVTWSDAERGRGPTGTAIRTGKPRMCRNMLTDPQFEPWRDQALKRGYASSIALPLVAGGKAFGAITIYSRDPDPFTQDEEVLLSGLADDLAYGIMAIRLREERAASEIVRKQAEEALRVSEMKLRRLTESGIIGIAQTTVAGDMLDANDEFLRMIGYSRDDVAAGQLRWVDITPPEWLPVDRAAQAEASIHKMCAPYEKEYIRKDGSRVPILIGFARLEGSDTESIAFILDLTKRKKAEDETKRNEARLESLLKISQHHTASTQELLDLALEEAINLTGSKIGYIYHYNETNREFTLNTWSKNVMEQCAITDQPTVYKLGKTGIWGEAVRQAKPIIINDFHIPNPLMKGYPEGHAPLHKFMTLPVFIDGHIVGVVGVANKETDYNSSDVRHLTLLMDSAWRVAERRRAEQEVIEARAEAERRAAEIESFVSSLGEGVGLFNMEGELVFVNDAIRRMTGAPSNVPNEIWGKQVRILTLDRQPVFSDQYPSRRALRGETSTDNRYIAVSPWAEALVNITCAPVRDSQENIIGATVVWRDIAEQVALEEKQQELYEREHHIAEVLQQALIPPTVPTEIGGFKIGVRYQPALKEAEVGGDFYDVFDLGNDKIGVLIGDVVGKGLAAAIRVAAARYSVRSYAFIDPRPSHVLTLANEALCKDSGDEASLLTAFFAVINIATGRVTYASAGHEPPLICRASGAIEELMLGGMPLGVRATATYGEEYASLDQGDSIILVTDGITEARAPGTVLFDKKGIIQYLSNNTKATPDETAFGLIKAATEHAGGKLQDDAAVIVVSLATSGLGR